MFIKLLSIVYRAVLYSLETLTIDHGVAVHVVTTARQDRLMRLTHLRNRTRTAVETAITTPGTPNHRISAQTVHNRLREFGIRAYRPHVGNPFTPRRRLACMQWLRRHDPRIWRRQRWQAVLFTDESRFNLFRADGRRRVYRRRNERNFTLYGET